MSVCVCVRARACLRHSQCEGQIPAGWKRPGSKAREAQRSPSPQKCAISTVPLEAWWADGCQVQELCVPGLRQDKEPGPEYKSPSSSITLFHAAGNILQQVFLYKGSSRRLYSGSSLSSRTRRNSLRIAALSSSGLRPFAGLMCMSSSKADSRVGPETLHS